MRSAKYGLTWKRVPVLHNWCLHQQYRLLYKLGQIPPPFRVHDKATHHHHDTHNCLLPSCKWRPIVIKPKMETTNQILTTWMQFSTVESWKKKSSVKNLYVNSKNNALFLCLLNKNSASFWMLPELFPFCILHVSYHTSLLQFAWPITYWSIFIQKSIR